MSIGRKSNLHIENLEGYWVYGSIDTKKKIESFFVDSLGFTKSVNPIIINNTRPFSYYEFTKSHENVNVSMLVITKLGFQRINKICSSVKSEKEIQWCLYNHFMKRLGPSQYNLLSGISKILPLLAKHYYKYRDSNTIYNSDTLSKYLCIIYPLSIELRKGLSTITTNIVLSKEDELIKDRMYVN